MIFVFIQTVLHLKSLFVNPLKLVLKALEELFHLRRQMDVVLRLDITFSRQFNAYFLDRSSFFGFETF